MVKLEEMFKTCWSLEFTDEVKHLVSRIVEKIGEDGIRKDYFIQQQIVHSFGSKYHPKKTSIFDTEEKITNWLEKHGTPR